MKPPCQKLKKDSSAFTGYGIFFRSLKHLPKALLFDDFVFIGRWTRLGFWKSRKVIDKYYNGKKDMKTVQILHSRSAYEELKQSYPLMLTAGNKLQSMLILVKRKIGEDILMLNFETMPIIAMLHLKGNSDEEKMERLKKESEIYYRNGVDAVLVENYFGDIRNCEQALEYLYKNMPDRHYGVNILGDYKTAFELAKTYRADFVQIDSVCGHLPPEEDIMFENELIELMKGRSFQVLGGLRFKYQPIKSGRTLEEDAIYAKKRCDAVVTTGDGTGKECPTEKLAQFKALLNGFPLIVGAGVTAYNVCEKLQFADGVIIGSWLKEGHQDYGDVCEEYVKDFMVKVREHKAKSVK